jgi:probable O-glycosylation ligase (exosortase A-associated)
MASIYAISHQGTGPGGILNDENDLSLFLLVYMPLVLFVISQERALLKKILWIGSVLLIVVAIFFTKSRGGFVGLCAVAAAYWWCSKKKLKVLLIFFMVVFLGIAIGGNAYKDEITSITNLKENTARTRLLSWKAGFDMFVDNPLGVGGYNFSVLFPDYQPEEMNRNMWGRAAHSIWFTLLPETGVVGFVLYLSIIMMNIRDIKLLFRAVGDDFFHLLAISLSASFLGFFAAATFLSVLYYPYFWHLTLMLMISRKLVEFGSISDSDNTSPKTR